MRYYEVHYPGVAEPSLTTNVKALRNLPSGTHIHAIVTERDGTLAETYEIPIQDGRAVIAGQGNRRPKAAQGRF